MSPGARPWSRGSLRERLYARLVIEQQDAALPVSWIRGSCNACIHRKSLLVRRALSVNAAHSASTVLTTLTTGEGGILLLDDEPTYRRCLALRDHGRAPGDMMYWSHLVGQKYRMSSMQARSGWRSWNVCRS